MTAQPYNRFVFVSWSWHLPCNGNQALELIGHLVVAFCIIILVLYILKGVMISVSKSRNTKSFSETSYGAPY